jgi:hypothetical protein
MRARTDSGKLKKAYQNYETLRQAGAVSRPVSERHVGIIIGRGFTYIAAEGECDETENFVHEATVLANRIRLVGYEATVGLCETKEAMGELCNNPAITDLLFVGNGNICGIEVDRKPSLRIDTTLTPRPRTTPMVFDWWD